MHCEQATIRKYTYKYLIIYIYIYFLIHDYIRMYILCNTDSLGHANQARTRSFILTSSMRLLRTSVSFRVQTNFNISDTSWLQQVLKRFKFQATQFTASSLGLASISSAGLFSPVTERCRFGNAYISSTSCMTLFGNSLA